MNDDEIEQKLRDLPAPALPESWRESILATARREAAPPQRARDSWPAVLAYWRHLCVRNPVTAGALTVLWLLILVLKTATPTDPLADRMMARIESGPPPHIVPLREELRLADLMQEDSAPWPQQP